MPRGRKATKRRERVDDRKFVESADSGFYTPTKLEVPEGVTFFEIPKQGPYRFDILPYVVGEGNEQANQGAEYYQRTYFAHYGLGPDKKQSYVCPTSFGKPCPICEYASKLDRDDDDDDKLFKSLRPKRRQLFNVWSVDDPDKGVQIFEISYYNFGEALYKFLKYDAEWEKYKGFWYPDEGFTIKANFDETKLGAVKFMKASNIFMEEREEQYDDSIFDDTYCLDELLIDTPYEDIEAAFLMKDGEEAPKKKTTKGRGRPKKEEVEEEEEEETGEIMTADEAGITLGCSVWHEEHGDCVVKNISRDGTSLILADSEDEVHKAIGCADVELYEAEDEDPEDDEEEDEGWEEDDEAEDEYEEEEDDEEEYEDDDEEEDDEEEYEDDDEEEEDEEWEEVDEDEDEEGEEEEEEWEDEDEEEEDDDEDWE